MMLMTWFDHSTWVAADWIVMPRLRSSSRKSMVASPSWTSPTLWILAVTNRMRSVTVVLPASMWAMMPMLRPRRRRSFPWAGLVWGFTAVVMLAGRLGGLAASSSRARGRILGVLGRGPGTRRGPGLRGLRGVSKRNTVPGPSPLSTLLSAGAGEVRVFDLLRRHRNARLDRAAVRGVVPEAHRDPLGGLVRGSVPQVHEQASRRSSQDLAGRDRLPTCGH